MVLPHEQNKRGDDVSCLEGCVDSLLAKPSVSVSAASVIVKRQVDMKDLTVSRTAGSSAEDNFSGEQNLTDFKDTRNTIFCPNNISINSFFVKSNKTKCAEKEQSNIKSSNIFLPNTDSETIEDIQKFLKMSGFSVTPSLDRMPIKDSKLLTFPKITLNNNSSVFAESTSNARMHLSCNSIQALKKPVFSMSDISVVVPSTIPLSEAGTDYNAVDISAEDARLDAESLQSAAYPFVTASGTSETSVAMLTNETSYQNSSASSPSQCSEQLSDISKFYPESQNFGSCSDEVLMSVENGCSDLSSLNEEESGDFEKNEDSLKVSNDLSTFSNSEPVHQNFEHDSCTTSSCGELSTEDTNSLLFKSEDAEKMSTRITAENVTESIISCKDKDERTYFINFSDEETLTVSDWQYVGGAKHKQKRKQNRHQPNPRPHYKQHTHSTKSSLSTQKKESERKLSYKSGNDQQQTIPNRFLRLKARHRNSAASRESPVNSKTYTNSSYVPNASTPSNTVDSWKKSVGCVHTSYQNNVSTSVEISEQKASSSSVQSQSDSSGNHPTTHTRINGATMKPSEPVKVYQPRPVYPSNSINHIPGNASAIETDPATSHIGRSVAGTTTPILVADVKPKLDGAELMRVLKRQLEYYFSSDNLSQDSYLNSQMDSDQWVPIWIIANFNAVKKLTSDFSLVVEALRESSLVEVDEKSEKVRPNQNLCAVILREIPDGTTKEEIEALFDSASVKLTTCNYAGNTNWYVIFQTENDAQSAYRHLRENVREFKGKTILARIKSKLHHVSTYSQKTETSYPNSVDSGIQPGNPQINQQIAAPPVDFVPQQFLVYAPPPQFAPASPHIAGHMTAPVPPFLPKVGPTSASPVASNAPVSGSAVAINPHFMSCVVSHPSWPAANIYQSPDGQVMRPQIAGPFVQPTFKPSSYPQYQQTASASKSSSTGRRFSELQEGANQKGNYSKPKASSSSFVQQQQPPSTASAVTSQTQPFYMIADPSSTGVQTDVIQYVHADQPSVAYVPQSVPGVPRFHYVPAVNANFVNRPPFVTPNANDRSLVVTPAHPQHVNILPQRFAYHPANPAATQRAGYYPSDQNPNNVVTSHHGRYPGSTRPSTQSHHGESSPRYHNGGHAYNGTAYRSNSRDASSADAKLNSSANSGYGDQHKVCSPSAAGTEFHSDSPKVHPANNDYYLGDAVADHLNRHTSMRRNTAAPFTSPPFNDQRHFNQGLERRNPRLRRGRRSDDEPAPSSYSANASFNFESQSFPPLPTSTAMPEVTSCHDQQADNRPAIANVVKGIETTKDFVNKENPATVSSRKTPNSCETKTSVESKLGRTTRNNDTKTMSAVNTQLVADKNPPVVTRQPKPSIDEKFRDNSNGRSSRPCAETLKKSAKKQNSNDWSNMREENFTSPTSTVSGTSESERNAMMRSLSIEEKGSTGKETDVNSDVMAFSDAVDQNNVSSDAKPTYAQMLKVQKAAAAAAAQNNGKSMSDSGKSDSDDDVATDDESKEKVSSDLGDQSGKAVSLTNGNESAKTDANRRRGMNGHRRGDYEPRRGVYRYYHDRNDEHRRNPRQGWGNGQFRGRGGYRSRRMFRDNRYHNNPGPLPNGHSNIDR